MGIGVERPMRLLELQVLRFCAAVFVVSAVFINLIGNVLCMYELLLEFYRS